MPLAGAAAGPSLPAYYGPGPGRVTSVTLSQSLEPPGSGSPGHKPSPPAAESVGHVPCGRGRTVTSHFQVATSSGQHTTGLYLNVSATPPSSRRKLKGGSCEATAAFQLCTYRCNIIRFW